MKKLLILALTVAVLASLGAIFCSAVTRDEAREIIYYTWGGVSDNISGSEPLNWLSLDYGEVAGESGVRLVYAEGAGPYDPYYSMSKIDFNEYKYCSIRSYFDTPAGREGVKSSFLVQFSSNAGGNIIYVPVHNPANQWTTEIVSFKVEDGVSAEWPDKGAVVHWFRYNAAVKEGESIYIKWIAFFKTREQAEAFEGFADRSAYEKAVLAAGALRPAEYTNYGILEEALAKAEEVSDLIFVDDQPAIDAAEKAVRDAMDALISVRDTRGDALKPEVTSVVGTELDVMTEDTAETVTDAPADTADEPDTQEPAVPDADTAASAAPDTEADAVTDAPSDNGTAPETAAGDETGCGSSISLSVSLLLLSLFAAFSPSVFKRTNGRNQS